jgi:hypothetical protein
MAIGTADHVWSNGDLLDAALSVSPAPPTTSTTERRRQLRVIDGGSLVGVCCLRGRRNFLAKPFRLLDPFKNGLLGVLYSLSGAVPV